MKTLIPKRYKRQIQNFWVNYSMMFTNKVYYKSAKNCNLIAQTILILWAKIQKNSNAFPSKIISNFDCIFLKYTKMDL
jgi:hypothetical protein